MFVALSRRGQTLVQRQIHLIDEFGRDEADPDALARLFALDHLAARMRRNEENLLVLAGGEPGRWITRPVAMVDLIRAAAQEIEEYRRVEVVRGARRSRSPPRSPATPSTCWPSCMENATSFSPPGAAGTGRPPGATADGLTITRRRRGHRHAARQARRGQPAAGPAFRADQHPGRHDGSARGRPPRRAPPRARRTRQRRRPRHHGSRRPPGPADRAHSATTCWSRRPGRARSPARRSNFPWRRRP